MEFVNCDETLDDLLINGLQIIQKTKGFRFTLDAVLLAHFVSLKEGDRVVDLGSGTGIIPLLLTTRLNKIQVTGVEIQQEMAQMANRSVEMNQLTEKIIIMEGDLRNIHKSLGGGIFHVVTANPPYGALGEGLINPEHNKALARHEIKCSLEDVVQSASKLLNYQGRFALIHRVERLADLFTLLRQYDLEPRRLRFIHPYLGKPARHLLLESRKKAPADLQVLPPLVVYEKPGQYNAEILTWYGKE